MNSSIKLTDAQLLILSAASRREDCCLTAPKSLKRPAAEKLAAKLLAARLVREIKAKPNMPVWRRDEDAGRAWLTIMEPSPGSERRSASRNYYHSISSTLHRDRRNVVGRLRKKVAVITGGTDGIGFAVAKLFVEEGAYVFITGRRQKELDKAVEAIGRNATGVQGDVSNLADLDRLYESIQAEGRRIDVVLANAGFGEFAALGDITEA